MPFFSLPLSGARSPLPCLWWWRSATFNFASSSSSLFLYYLCAMHGIFLPHSLARLFLSCSGTSEARKQNGFNRQSTPAEVTIGGEREREGRASVGVFCVSSSSSFLTTGDCVSFIHTKCASFHQEKGRARKQWVWPVVLLLLSRLHMNCSRRISIRETGKRRRQVSSQQEQLMHSEVRRARGAGGGGGWRREDTRTAKSECTGNDGETVNRCKLLLWGYLVDQQAVISLLLNLLAARVTRERRRGGNSVTFTLHLFFYSFLFCTWIVSLSWKRHRATFSHSLTQTHRETQTITQRAEDKEGGERRREHKATYEAIHRVV